MEAEAEAKPTQVIKVLPNFGVDRRDLLLHLEAYLARRDGVDKLLKILRYTAKIAIASSLSPETLKPRLKAFESSIGLSRKAFRLGKFVQDLNALRDASGRSTSAVDFFLHAASYGGEGIYYFLEQVVWLSKAGILSPELGRRCQKLSAWAELIGYVGSITLRVKEVRKIRETIDVRRRSTGLGDGDDVETLMKLRDKLVLKKLSLVQDVADGLMVLGDLRDGKGFLTDPLVMASCGMISALIGTHKNWISC